MRNGRRILYGGLVAFAVLAAAGEDFAGAFAANPDGLDATRGALASMSGPEERFAGVGLEVADVNGEVSVVRVTDGAPAVQAGILPGDAIVAVDGWPTKGVPLPDVVARVRGGEGKPVILSIRRDGWTQARDFTIVRKMMTAKTQGVPVPPPSPTTPESVDKTIERILQGK